MRGRVAVLAAIVGLTPVAVTAQVQPGQPDGIGLTGHAPFARAEAASQVSTHNAPPPVSQLPPMPHLPERALPPPPPEPSPAAATDQFLASPETYAPRYDRRLQRRLGRSGLPFGYSSIGRYAPYFGYYMPYDVESVAGDFGRAAEPEPEGRLYLSVTPDTAQVFVDGFYVGTAADFGERLGGLVLEAGARRVELRAEGYETLTFDVRIVAGEAITYRNSLGRLGSSAQATRAALATPKTFYVIPRCYAGDSPPRSDRLPPGCTTANLRRVPPVVAAASGATSARGR